MNSLININPLSAVMGAEITGVNLSSTIDKKIKNLLLKAITDFSVICVRGQNLKPKDLVNISKIFGTPKKYFIKMQLLKEFLRLLKLQIDQKILIENLRCMQVIGIQMILIEANQQL